MMRIYAFSRHHQFVSRLVPEKEYTIEEMTKILFEDFPDINQHYIKRIWAAKDTSPQEILH